MLDIVLNLFFSTITNLVFSKVLGIEINDNRKTEEEDIETRDLTKNPCMGLWTSFPNAQC